MPSERQPLSAMVNAAKQIDAAAAKATGEEILVQLRKRITHRIEESDPIALAEIHFQFAYAHLVIPFKSRKRHLDQASEHARKAFDIFDIQKYPIEYGTTALLLGNAYSAVSEQVTAQRAELRERATSLYENALAVFNETEAPETAAFIHKQLGETYAAPDSETEEDLRNAISHLVRAQYLFESRGDDLQVHAVQNLVLSVVDRLQTTIRTASYEKVTAKRDQLNAIENEALFDNFVQLFVSGDPQLSRVPRHLLRELMDALSEIGSDAFRSRRDNPFPYVALDSFLQAFRTRGTFFAAEPEPSPDLLDVSVEKIGLVEYRTLGDLAQNFEALVPRAGTRTIPNYAVVTVFYGTDRNITGSSSPTQFYADGRLEAPRHLSVGSCDVSIPRDHRMGHLERPRLWRLEFAADPNRHISLLAVRQHSYEHFVALLQDELQNSKRKQAFVFVHGYNVSFADAMLRTGQLAYDLGFDGLPIAYSWPSAGSAKLYLADEASIEASLPYLVDFLERLLIESGIEILHLVAHSMGNRALTRALDMISLRPKLKGKIRQVILAAPDIDAEVFKQIASAVSSSCERLTLYASDRDLALLASRTIHRYARAGDGGPKILVLPQIDTIDASSVETDLLGHSYYAEDRSLLSDMFLIINYGHAPDDRFGLAPVVSAAGTYWRFKQ